LVSDTCQLTYAQYSNHLILELPENVLKIKMARSRGEAYKISLILLCLYGLPSKVWLLGSKPPNKKELLYFQTALPSRNCEELVTPFED